jgi:O-antigen/teichoic acid export membrane protein
LTGTRPFHRRVVLNTLASGAGNVWAMVVAFVSVPLLLTGLGTAAFGLYALLLTFSAVNGWFSLADLGMWTAATRGIAAHASTDDRDAASEVAHTALVAVPILGCVAAVVFVVAGSAWLPAVFRAPDALVDDLRLAIACFAGTIVLDLLNGTAQSCLEGYQRVDLSRACDALRRGVFAAATVATALAGGGIGGVAVAGLGAAALGTVVTLAALRPYLRAGARRRAPFVPRFAELLRAGRTVAVLRPLGVLERTVNRTVVGMILGPVAVAAVEIATQVQNGADAVLSASSYAVVPSASWLSARRDHETLRALVVSGTKYAVAVTGCVAGLGLLLVAPALRLWVGPSAAGRSTDLAVLGLLSVVMVAPMAVGSNLLLGVDRAGAILRAAAMAMVVNLAASIVLVDRIGPRGAFLATLAANLIVVPVITRAFLRYVGIRTGRFVRASVLPSLPPFAAMGAAVVLVRLASLGDAATVALGAGLGLLAFAAVARVTLVSKAELRELFGALRRSARVERVEVLEGVSL